MNVLRRNPGSVLMIDHRFASSLLKSDARLVSILDTESSPSEACFMTPNGSWLIGLIESIADEMLTYGFNKRILDLNRIKEVPRKIVFSSQIETAKLELITPKTFYFLFQLLGLGYFLSIVMQVVELLLCSQVFGRTALSINVANTIWLTSDLCF